VVFTFIKFVDNFLHKCKIPDLVRPVTTHKNHWWQITTVLIKSESLQQIRSLCR